MTKSRRSVLLRDSTLREGMDVPGVRFATDERVRIAAALAAAGVPEAEVVAPARVADDAPVARAIRAQGAPIRLSALVYANRAGWRRDLEALAGAVDRTDLLMPLSGRREPRDPAEKLARIEEALGASGDLPFEIGAGFPHSLQADPAFLLEIARRAVAAGARRVTLYDTNGGGEPFGVRELVARIVAAVDAPVFFHGHDDLGLATANAWAAVLAGAAGLDVTVNGLGDRAGNASLEQLVMLLRVRGVDTGVAPSGLRGLSRLVAETSGVPVPGLAPIVGRYVFEHESPAHGEAPTEFEAFDPAVVGGTRRV